MTYSILYLYLTVISLNFSIEYALNAQSIIGRLAEQANFKYQTIIVIRGNTYSTSSLICNGAIVAPNWILSVAHCFIHRSGRLMDYIFTAVVGSSDITASNANGFFENIVSVYTYYYDAARRTNDILMGKTNNILTRDNNLDLAGVAFASQSFLGEEGLVSGYGYSGSRPPPNVNYSDAVVRTDTDFKLRYTYVIIRQSECAIYFARRFSVVKTFCGVTRHNGNSFTGACYNDDGSPLVILNKVVGLVKQVNHNCDDTENGSLYTNVSEYHHFINSVISKTAMDGVIEYHLRIS